MKLPPCLDLTLFNTWACNIARPFSLLRQIVRERSGGIGEFCLTNGGYLWTERLMFRRVERQVESNDCLSLFLDVSSETLTFCPLIIEKKFPLKGGFVRQ